MNKSALLSSLFALWCIAHPMRTTAGEFNAKGNNQACTATSFWMNNPDRLAFAKGRDPESASRDKAYVALMDKFWGTLDELEKKKGSPVLVGDLLENIQQAFRRAAREHQEKIGQHGIRISLVFCRIGDGFDRPDIEKEFKADQLKNINVPRDKDVQRIIGEDDWNISIQFTRTKKLSHWVRLDVINSAKAQSIGSPLIEMSFDAPFDRSVIEQKNGCQKLKQGKTAAP